MKDFIEVTMDGKKRLVSTSSIDMVMPALVSGKEQTETVMFLGLTEGEDRSIFVSESYDEVKRKITTATST